VADRPCIKSGHPRRPFNYSQVVDGDRMRSPHSLGDFSWLRTVSVAFVQNYIFIFTARRYASAVYAVVV